MAAKRPPALDRIAMVLGVVYQWVTTPETEASTAGLIQAGGLVADVYAINGTNATNALAVQAARARGVEVSPQMTLLGVDRRPVTADEVVEDDAQYGQEQERGFERQCQMLQQALTDKARTHPFLLSGGQKRRLSVGTALVAGGISTVVGSTWGFYLNIDANILSITPSSFRSSTPSRTRMNSSCVGWMCGGTKVPGGLTASKAKELSQDCLG